MKIENKIFFKIKKYYDQNMKFGIQNGWRINQKEYEGGDPSL